MCINVQVCTRDPFSRGDRDGNQKVLRREYSGTREDGAVMSMTEWVDIKEREERIEN